MYRCDAFGRRIERLSRGFRQSISDSV